MRVKDSAQRGSGRGRALLIAVTTALVTLVGGLCWPTVASAAVGVPTSYLGHTYGSTESPSEDKPQSKLWFHDDAWWALMVGTGGTAVYIHELMPDHTWRNTGALVDDRLNSTGDALWSVRDSRLYVATRAWGSNLEVNAFTYDSANRSWSTPTGFPVMVRSGGASESATIDQDSLGNLWVTYTRASQVWVAHSTNASRTTWTAGFRPNVPDYSITSDDISALITFGDSIGLMWSDQGSEAMRFAVRGVGAADTAPWQVEDALAGTRLADDHINLKQLAGDPQGRIFAAVKTSADAGNDPGAALVGVLTRTPGASGAPAQWEFTAAGTVAQGWTRPMIMIDDTNDDLYFFASESTGAGGEILYRRSDLPSDPSQGLSLTPTQVFLDTAPSLNNASGAKDPVTGNTGLVVIATSQGQKRYAHAEMALAPGGRFDGGGADTTAPTVTATSPVTGATGVAVGGDVTATFDEDVAGVDGTTFTLTPAAGGAAVPAVVTYDSTTRVATLDPNADLAAGTQYIAALSGAITDAAGNPLAPTGWSFTTEVAGDTTPPTVTSTVPAAGATGVAVADHVTATFSEDVTGVDGATFTLAPAAGGAGVPAAVSYDTSTRVATLDPNADLAAGTQYTATLGSGITDGAGNPLAATSWSFTTAAAADTTPPTVTSTVPAAGATGVAPGAAVSATFSEDVAGVDAATFTLTPASGGAAVPAAVSYDSATRVATLDPNADLAAGTQYTASLGSGITDGAGNPLAATSWSFTTASTGSPGGPVVTDRSPAPGTGGVALSANVTATFSTDVQDVHAGTFTLTDVATGASVAAAVTYDAATRVATLNPDANLAAEARYRAALTSGIRDASGNALAAETWEFSTGQPPTLTGRFPGPNATGVSGTANVSAVFSEAVQNVTTTTFTLTPAAGGPAVPAVVSRVSGTNKWLLNPDQTLSGETQYIVTVAGGPGGVTDLAGNPLATTITWSFTTQPGADTQPPVVVSTSPAAGATGVAVGEAVTASFSESVTGVSGSTFTLAPAAGGSAVEAVVTYDGATRVATLDPDADLAAGTQYTASLGSGISDAAGNPLSGTSWSFTTATAGGGGDDTTPPTVTATSPGAGATGVEVGVAATATFSEDVTGVTGSTFTLAPTAGGAAVAATVSYDGASRVATLDPTADLAAGTQYTASLSSGIIDAAGNPLTATGWSFTTAAAADTTPPTVTATSPAVGATGVAVGVAVTATFSEAVTGVNGSTFTLAPAAGGSVVAAAVAYDGASRVATLDPNADLAAGTQYTATLGSGITDGAGNPLAGTSWSFTTASGTGGDAVAPTLTGRYPGPNGTGVSRTANMSAVFSEAVQNVTTTTFTLTPASGGPAVPAAVTRVNGTNKWLLNPDQTLAGETQYVVTLAGGPAGITDLAGNPLASTITWSFTTGP